MKKVITLGILCLFLLGFWKTSYGYEDSPLKKLQEKKRKILIYNYIRSLELTPKQLFQIYSIAITHHRQRMAFQKEYKEVEKQTKEAFWKLKKALLDGEDPPKKLGGRASNLEHKLKDMRQEFQEILRYHQEEILDVLTEKQRKIALTPPPLYIAPKGFKHWPHKKRKRGHKGKKAGEGQGRYEGNSQEAVNFQGIQLLQKLRSMEEEKFEKTKEELIQKRMAFLRQKMGKGLTEKEKEIEKQRFSKVLDEIRNLPDKKFEKKKFSLLKKFRYQGLDAMERDLAKIRAKWSQQKNVENTVGKFLLREDCLEILKRFYYGS
ncbi:MAG: hypothetical protein D6785_10800 [Planctomycetota bacterium]|nr:MAG: hypothetical protein D6785_10800 [Planctomycetota bacterium]